VSSANPNSAYSIICDGLRECGKLQRGSEPDSELLADTMRRLNDMVNLWQTQGLKLWLQFDLPVPLQAGVNPYTLGPGGSVNMAKPTRVLDNGYYLDQGNVRRPLIMLSRDEYTRLSVTTQQGPLSNYFVDKQQAVLIVWFWLVPDAQAATGIAHLLIQQQVSNFVNLTDDMNFPNEWRIALVWGIADEMSTGQPKAVQDRCSIKAAAYFDSLNSWDVEDASTMFQPDARAMQHTGSFR
jgi:hypothetical protein